MSILNEIFANKRLEVAEAKVAVPFADLKSQSVDLEETKGFIRALKAASTEIALIAEVKKGSPSQGVIREDFSPEDVARTYTEAGAHCLSVLTDQKYFSGSASYLRRVRKATSLPLLRKDFIDDPYQIYEARVWGADAILLIAAALEKNQIEDLYALSQSLGLDVLVEVHNEQELDLIEGLDLPLVGINNRDLSTLKTDLSTTDRLMPRVAPKSLGVSESALDSYENVCRVRDAGAKAVLIGTAFCSAPDIDAKIREVMGWS